MLREFQVSVSIILSYVQLKRSQTASSEIGAVKYSDISCCDGKTGNILMLAVASHFIRSNQVDLISKMN